MRRSGRGRRGRCWPSSAAPRHDFDRTLFVSRPRRRRFAELAPESRGARIDWVDNGVDLARFDPAIAASRDPFAPGAPAIVFTGTMDYRPNVEAVCWFAAGGDAAACARRRPGARVPHRRRQSRRPPCRPWRALPGVHVTGRVPDVRPYLAHAAVAVAPLRIARGIQNKVLEAMAMARPVVASPQAHRGGPRAGRAGPAGRRRRGGDGGSASRRCWTARIRASAPRPGRRCCAHL